MYLQIAIKNFSQQTLTYRSHMATQNLIGYRVIVPFGKTEKIGLVVGTEPNTSLDADKIKRVLKTLDQSPLVLLEHLQFLTRLSQYYKVSLNQLVLAALPSTLLDPEYPCDQIYYGRHHPGQTAAQIKALNALETPITFTDLQLVLRPSMAQTLIQQGSLMPCKGEKKPVTHTELPTLTDAQKSVFDAIQQQAPGPHLLWGITGSGKTEVYIHLIQEALKRHKQCLIMVPEIALTPQIHQKIAQRLALDPVSLHSLQPPRKRTSYWMKARHGDAHVVIGTRSALLCPIDRLGLIIVDEEHSDAYRQETPFFFSARDAAILKAAILNIPVILGSATPSLETLHNAQQNRYHLHELLCRYNASKPSISLVTVEKDQYIANRLIPIVTQALANDTHVMLYIGKRGYSRLLRCHHCGYQACCPACERPLIKHQTGRMHCHNCDSSHPSITDCPSCQQAELSQYGAGSQKIVEIAEALWPNHPTLRVDTDAMNKLDAGNVLQSLNTAPATIIVGTQMLTKGHDIERLNTVIVVSADHMLFSPDFRGEEKLYAELTQVIGRSGRRQTPGVTYIQTQHSKHPLFEHLNHRKTMYDYLLHKRQEFMLPPYQYMACIFIHGPEAKLKYLNHMRLSQYDLCQIIGPVPYPAGKKKTHVCYKVMISSECRTARGQCYLQILKALSPQLPKTATLTGQIDSHLSP